MQTKGWFYRVGSRRTALFGLMVIQIVAAACNKDVQGPDLARQNRAVMDLQLASLSPDGISARIASASVPGFGGFIYKDNRLTILLRNGSDGNAARAKLIGLNDAGQLPFGIKRSELEGAGIQSVAFAYDELLAARTSIRDLLATPWVTGIGIDVAKNRVLVGVRDVASLATVSADINNLRLRPELFSIEVRPPARLMSALADTLRPYAGGERHTGLPGGECSIGFNIKYPSDSNAYWATASHCTPTYGYDGNDFYQPAWPQYHMGVEFYDLGMMLYSSCPTGRSGCRYSDAAIMRYDSASLVTQGGIYRTTALGSRTINSSSPMFNISSEYAYGGIVGQYVYKVGLTTGWTHGQIASVCYDENVYDVLGNDTGYTMLCQTVVSDTVDHGDSGAPVFAWSGSGSDVELRGLVWAGGNTFYEFSPLWAIKQELSGYGSWSAIGP